MLLERKARVERSHLEVRAGMNPKVAVWTLPNDPAGADWLVPAARDHHSGSADAHLGPCERLRRTRRRLRAARQPASGGSLTSASSGGRAAAELSAGTQWEYSPSTGFDAQANREILGGITLEQFSRPASSIRSACTTRSCRAGRSRCRHHGRIREERNGLARPPSSPAARVDRPGQLLGAGGLTGSAADYLAFSQMR